MMKIYANPKLFKHEKVSSDSERGGGVTKKDSEVTNIVKLSTQTCL